METDYSPDLNSKRGRPLQELSVVDPDELDAPPPRKGFNPGPYLRMLRRKSLVILSIAGLVTGAAVIYIKGAPDTYESGFQLLVEPVTNEGRVSDPSVLSRSDGSVPNRDIFTLDYPTQLEILQSPKIMSDIVEKVRLRYPKVSEIAIRKGLVVKRFAKENSPEPTKILQVSYSAGDPNFVQYVLEVVQERYLRYSLEERKSRIGEGVKFIEDQLPELQLRVDKLQTTLQKLQQQNRLTDPNAQGAELFKQVQDLTTQQLTAQRELQEQRTLYANLQRQLDLTPNEAIAASALSQNPQYNEIQTKYQEIENQLAVERGRFLPDSPNIQSLEAKRESLLALLNQQAQEIIGQNLSETVKNPQVRAFQNEVRLSLIGQLVSTGNQIEVLEVRYQGLAQTKAIYDEQARRFPAIARQYTDQQRQLDIAKRTLDQLLTQRETLRVEAAQKQVPWDVLAKPEVPRDQNGIPIPAPGDAKKKLMMALVASLILGVGTALLIEKSQNIFYSSDDIKDAVSEPLLGVIPLDRSIKKSTTPYAWVGRINQSETDSPFLEAFDSLYTNLCFNSTLSVRSLVVGSAMSGDGKSTIALNLAQTAAAMGARVLLVDANLRSPSLHLRLNLPNSLGLSDLLAKQVAPDDLLTRSLVVDNLSVLTAGEIQPNSSKLLGSAQMRHLAEKFRGMFDLVIYDTPNLSEFRDANFLAAHTDGILMVATTKKTARSTFNQVLGQVKNYRLPILGIVANQVKKGLSPTYSSLTLTPAIVEDEAEQEEMLVLQHSKAKFADFQSDKSNERTLS